MLVTLLHVRRVLCKVLLKLVVRTSKHRSVRPVRNVTGDCHNGRHVIEPVLRQVTTVDKAVVNSTGKVLVLAQDLAFFYQFFKQNLCSPLNNFRLLSISSNANKVATLRRVVLDHKVMHGRVAKASGLTFCLHPHKLRLNDALKAHQGLSLACWRRDVKHLTLNQVRTACIRRSRNWEHGLVLAVFASKHACHSIEPKRHVVASVHVRVINAVTFDKTTKAVRLQPTGN